MTRLSGWIRSRALAEGRAARVLGAILAIWLNPLGHARDAFVVISGGDSPFENNYSQYLQARAVETAFLERYAPESVWTFFGAGNVEGERPVFGDVRRQIVSRGRPLDTWLPGMLRRNRPARRREILRAFREEILPTVAHGGTLFLFVGDHGSRTEGEDGESIISLWSLHRDRQSDRGWRSMDNEVLGVTELRDLLIAGLGRGRLVFCMTQCHAGGFHDLAGLRSVEANPKWFRVLPGWVNAQDRFVPLAVAGFSATDEYSPAAGCNPAPDPTDWAGYERYFPEHLFGLDLFTLTRARPALSSFAEAHVAATLADRTIDKPYSTSEHYLERWATMIESRLSHEPALTRRAEKAMEGYPRWVDGDLPRIRDRRFLEQQRQFAALVEAMVKEDPGVGEALLGGTRDHLEDLIDPERRASTRIESVPGPEPDSTPPPPRRSRRRGARRGQELRRLWNENLRPAWAAAVEDGELEDLLGVASDFERHLLQLEADGEDFFSGGPRSRMLEEVFWQSGYSDPSTLNRDRARAVVRWGTDRRTTILEWARQSDLESVRAAADRTVELRPGRAAPGEAAANAVQPAEPMSRQTAAARALHYRRVLAAWAFLLTMKEKPALDRLEELLEVEHTPLPTATRELSTR